MMVRLCETVQCMTCILIIEAVLLSQSTSRGQAVGSTNHSEDEIEDDPPLIEPFAQLSLAKPSSSEYLSYNLA
jgi:ABC-type cobalt transport system substrate-binding protein